MRKLFLCFALVPCVALLVACPKKKEEVPDAEPVAAVDAAPPPPAAPIAKNAADVARFPAAEKPVADDDAKTLDFAQARTGPKSGNIVALVKPGTDPFKIADHQDCFLVTFPDPKDATASLMGWIPKTAFTTIAVKLDAGVKDAAVDAAVVFVPAVPVKCPAGQELVVNVVGSGGVCRRKCATDKDCKNPAVNACQSSTTPANKITKVCVNELP